MNKTFHIITIGCQMNKSDSERIAAYLQTAGWTRVEERSQADLVILTTCGVRQSAEDRVYGLAPKLKKENPAVKIILTGCLSDRQDVRRRLSQMIDVWMNIKDLPRLGFELSKIFKSGLRAPVQPGANIMPGEYLKIQPDYSCAFSAFVPIGNGCDNFCSYCVVPYARGRETYRPATDIMAEVRCLIEGGCREITFIAQNVNSYINPDSESGIKDFADLLRAVDGINEDFWIRFSTSHPKDMSAKLIKIMAEGEKVCEHLHLPVQAGDDFALKKMNRGYTAAHYAGLIAQVRTAYQTRQKKINHIIPSLTTDIIVGFPGETADMFRSTADLLEKIKFDMAYISQYSPRPGTAAASLKDDVPKAIKKDREEKLMRILRQTSLENNRKYIHKTVKVLVEAGNEKKGYYGKTKTGKNVNIKPAGPIADSLIGSFANVEITEVQDFGLSGRLSPRGSEPRAINFS